MRAGTITINTITHFQKQDLTAQLFSSTSRLLKDFSVAFVSSWTPRHGGRKRDLNIEEVKCDGFTNCLQLSTGVLGDGKDDNKNVNVICAVIHQQNTTYNTQPATSE